MTGEAREEGVGSGVVSDTISKFDQRAVRRRRQCTEASSGGDNPRGSSHFYHDSYEDSTTSSRGSLGIFP